MSQAAFIRGGYTLGHSATTSSDACKMNMYPSMEREADFAFM